MKIFLRSTVILSILFSTILIIYAVPMTWEEIKSKDWQSDDSIVAEDFNTIIEQIAIHSGLDNFLGMFALIVDKVQEIEEKFINSKEQILTSPNLYSRMPDNTYFNSYQSATGSKVDLDKGLYFVQFYLCSGHFSTSWGALADVEIFSGEGNIIQGYFNDGTLANTCGYFYSTVLKITSETASVAMKLSSYAGSTMTDYNPSGNAFSATFIKIL